MQITLISFVIYILCLSCLLNRQQGPEKVLETLPNSLLEIQNEESDPTKTIFLDLSNKDLQDLSKLTNYKRLIHLNLVGNPHLDLGTLQEHKNLLVLNADLTSVCPKKWVSIGLKGFCSRLRRRKSNYEIMPDTKAAALYQDRLPKGYHLIYRSWSDHQPQDKTGLIGSSGSAVVYLVQEEKTKKVFVAKFLKERTGIDPDDDQKEILLWQEKFNNPLEVQNFKDCSIKTFIEGPTLAEAFTSLDFFDGSKRSKMMQEKLKELYDSMWNSKIVVGDPSPMNHIYSDKMQRWVIVDGRSHQTFPTVHEARSAGRKEIRRLMGNLVFDYWQGPRLKKQIREGGLIYPLELGQLLDAYIEERVRSFFSSDLAP